MPYLSSELGYGWSKEKVYFEASPGVNIKATIDSCDAYVSLLVPDPDITASRISITGNEMIIEIPDGIEMLESIMLSRAFHAAELLGIEKDRVSSVRQFKQTYAKIIPIDDDDRKSFMHWATVRHNVYSLGRYATWRPKLLLDDLVNDIRKIDKWIGKSNKYELARDR
jgi:hypothetical protein